MNDYNDAIQELNERFIAKALRGELNLSLPLHLERNTNE